MVGKGRPYPGGKGSSTTLKSWAWASPKTSFCVVFLSGIAVCGGAAIGDPGGGERASVRSCIN